MKKPLLVLCTLLISFLSACSDHTNFDCITDSDLSGASSDISSDFKDDQQSQDQDEEFLISCIPRDFFYEEMHFKMDTEAILNNHDISDFFGYFVNLEDLEKWKEKDDSDDIIYVIDYNNSIFNYDLTGELTNRFELFSTHNQNEIALKTYGDYISYKKVENHDD